jgi:hypothetical protein
LRRAIGFDLSTSSTSKASPNDTGIVIIIIIIGEVIDFVHCGAIIAQSLTALEFGPLAIAMIKTFSRRTQMCVSRTNVGY